eukprot:COSAG02_NODE_46384_length_349_cov_0.820000_1_plen_36_part_10
MDSHIDLESSDVEYVDEDDGDDEEDDAGGEAGKNA